MKIFILLIDRLYSMYYVEVTVTGPALSLKITRHAFVMLDPAIHFVIEFDGINLYSEIIFLYEISVFI